MSLTTHLYLTPRSSGIPLLSLWAFMACSTVNFYHLQGSVAITFLNDMTFTHYISQCFRFNRFSDCGITSPYSLALRGLRFIWLDKLLCLCLCTLCVCQENILCFHPYLSLFKWMFICISHSADSVEPWYMVFPHLSGCKRTSDLRYAPNKHRAYTEKDMHNMLMACILMYSMLKKILGCV